MQKASLLWFDKTTKVGNILHLHDILITASVKGRKKLDHSVHGVFNVV